MYLSSQNRTWAVVSLNMPLYNPNNNEGLARLQFTDDLYVQ